MIKIIKLSISDATELSELAIEAYNGAYLDIWNDGGEWYKSKTYSVEQLSKELSEINNEFYFINLNDIKCGFLKVSPNSSLKNQLGKGFLIDKVYFLKEYTGKGLGEAVMNFAFSKAKTMDKDYVWLNAMATAPDAIRFYEKLNFKIVGNYQLDFQLLKNGFHGMVQMTKLL